MDKELRIEYKTNKDENIVLFYLEDEETAKYYKAYYLINVREMNHMAELYTRKNILCLSVPDERAAKSIAEFLEKEIKTSK